jgi:hypothetical protein
MTPHDELLFDWRRPMTQHMLQRLWGICEQNSWKHEDPQPGKAPLAFWPWGEDDESVRAGSAVAYRGEEQKVPYLILCAGRGALPLDLVREHLSELLRLCAHGGVSLTLGSEVPNMPAPGRWIYATLSLAITAKSLSAPALEEAVMLLYAARTELAKLCQTKAAD